MNKEAIMFYKEQDLKEQNAVAMSFGVLANGLLEKGIVNGNELENLSLNYAMKKIHIVDEVEEKNINFYDPQQGLYLSSEIDIHLLEKAKNGLEVLKSLNDFAENITEKMQQYNDVNAYIKGFNLKDHYYDLAYNRINTLKSDIMNQKDFVSIYNTIVSQGDMLGIERKNIEQIESLVNQKELEIANRLDNEGLSR